MQYVRKGSSALAIDLSVLTVLIAYIKFHVLHANIACMDCLQYPYADTETMIKSGRDLITHIDHLHDEDCMAPLFIVEENVPVPRGTRPTCNGLQVVILSTMIFITSIILILIGHSTVWFLRLSYFEERLKTTILGFFLLFEPLVHYFAVYAAMLVLQRDRPFFGRHSTHDSGSLFAIQLRHDRNSIDYDCQY